MAITEESTQSAAVRAALRYRWYMLGMLVLSAGSTGWPWSFRWRKSRSQPTDEFRRALGDRGHDRDIGLGLSSNDD
jgi:hypothetical protein